MLGCWILCLEKSFPNYYYFTMYIIIYTATSIDQFLVSIYKVTNKNKSRSRNTINFKGIIRGGVN